MPASFALNTIVVGVSIFRKLTGGGDESLFFLHWALALPFLNAFVYTYFHRNMKYALDREEEMVSVVMDESKLNRSFFIWVSKVVVIIRQRRVDKLFWFVEFFVSRVLKKDSQK